MQIAQVTQVEILEAVRNRLLDKLSDLFSHDSLYFDDQPLPRQTPDYPECCSIAVSNSVYGTQGYERTTLPPCGVMESCHVLVTPMVQMESEQPRNLNLSIAGDRSRGLITIIKPRILSALLVDYDGTTGKRQRWQPRTSEGYALLADDMTITGCTSPQEIEPHPYLGITLDFRVNWIWQL